MISVAMKVHTECGTCRLPMPVNTLAREVSCTSCGRPATVAVDLWQALLRHPTYDGPKMLPNEGRSTSTGKLSVTYTRRAATCHGCEKEIPVESIREVRDQATLTCDRCAKRTWVRKVPVELAEALPNITHLVGEDPDPAVTASAGAAEAATFPCPQCGSPVPFDGVNRACTCRFCSASVHVPDEFVYRGRRKVAASWFLCFDPSIAGRAPAAQAVAAGLFDWEDEPPEVAVDADGNLYCATKQGRWFSGKNFEPKFRFDHVLWSVDPLLRVRWIQRGRPRAKRLVLSPKGALLVTVQNKSPQPWLSSETGMPEDGIECAPPGIVEQLGGGDDLTCCVDGSLLILEGNKLRRIASNGVEIPVWPPSASGGHADNGLRGPCELADHPVQMRGGGARVHCGPDGSVYLISWDEIARFDASGRKMYGVAISSDSPVPIYCNLGADVHGNVYLLRHEQLVRISARGEQSVVLESKRDGLPRYNMTLAVCPDGAFWLFGKDGLAWKFGPGGTLLFDSGKEPRPRKSSREDLGFPSDSEFMASFKKACAQQAEQRRREEEERIKIDRRYLAIFVPCIVILLVAPFVLVVWLMIR
ncbi:hypothetical protein WMF31_21940 [Sorangium sp. So ce1036]|uniref:hypothetical protein n=1 Tax=Sorangium sp. So ce1036 TaxID=3133328 RepID=UPI003EFE9849